MSTIAQYIDLTLLRPEASIHAIENLCQEAIAHGCASVCIHPCWINDCRPLLVGSEVKICTVIGFPFGASTTEAKVFEAKQAMELGAAEIDMVINIGALKSGLPARAGDEIATMREAIPQAILKVIIETCLLSDSEKITACRFAMIYGADFVKTSTGFSTGGATIEDIILIKSVVSDKLGIKASGGIKNLDTAMSMIEAGATRLGCSAGVSIITEFHNIVTTQDEENN